MSRPITNWRPMMRIAWRKAVRTTGSPRRATRRRRKDAGSRISISESRTSLPVSIRPQVEAFTNSESAAPRWSDHCPIAILSAIRRSAVSASGMRSSASARHMRTTPSCEARPYCCRKDSIPVLPSRRPRAAATSAIASWRIASRSAAGSCASASSSDTTVFSSARKRGLIARPGADSNSASSGRRKRGVRRSCIRGF